MKKFFALFLAFLTVISFASCGKNEPADIKEPDIPEISENPEVSEPEKTPEKPVEIGRRKEVSSEEFKNATEIILSENIMVNGKPAGESDSVIVGGEIIYYHETEKYPSGNPYGEGSKKDMHTEEEAAEYTLVTITKPGEYFIKGELKGQIAVDLGEKAESDPNAKVTLIFGGADITCEIAPAVIFYNVYECGSTENPSKDADTSKAGANVVVADESVSNINGANVAKIYKDNGDAKKLHKYDAALYSKMSLNIGGGTEGTGILNINGKNEGLGSGMHLSLNGGIINISSKDDGINTNEDGVSVTAINGGKITIKSGTGPEGDGIDSNGWLVINGGELYSSGNGTGADGGIDADMAIIINGGTVAAFGGNNDIVRGECAQPFVQISFDERKPEGSEIRFTDKEGKGFSVKSDRSFQSLVLSFPELEKGREYGLYVNGILQEYTSDKEFFDEIGKVFNEVLNNKKNEPDSEKKHSGEFDETDLTKWFGALLGEAGKPYSENGKNGEKTNSLELQEVEEKDRTVFVVTDETKYFSGVHDSFKATGKERVEFTINGEKRIEDIYIGDLPGITSIECEKEIPEKHIILTLEYSGLSEEIEVKRSCVLSEGYKAINELFRDLQPGDYRFYVSVSSENKEYCGTSRFDFDVVD